MGNTQQTVSKPESKPASKDGACVNICRTYAWTKHCCDISCFSPSPHIGKLEQIPYGENKDCWAFAERHQQAVQTAIAKLECDMDHQYLTALLLLYLSAYPDIYQYYTHCHSAMQLHGQKLCNYWLQVLKAKEQRVTIQVCVIGAAKSGKTRLIQRFMLNSWLSEDDDSIDTRREYRKIQMFDQQMLLYDIVECLDDELMYYTTRKVFVLCFGIDDKSGTDPIIALWNRLKKQHDAQKQAHCCDLAVILVATRCDVMHDSDASAELCKRNRERAKQLSQIWNVPFLETSAKNNINVFLLFKQIAFEYWIQSQSECVNWNATEHNQFAK